VGQLCLLRKYGVHSFGHQVVWSGMEKRREGEILGRMRVERLEIQGRHEERGSGWRGRRGRRRGERVGMRE